MSRSLTLAFAIFALVAPATSHAQNRKPEAQLLRYAFEKGAVGHYVLMLSNLVGSESSGSGGSTAMEDLVIVNATLFMTMRVTDVVDGVANIGIEVTRAKFALGSGDRIGGFDTDDVESLPPVWKFELLGEDPSKGYDSLIAAIRQETRFQMDGRGQLQGIDGPESHHEFEESGDVELYSMLHGLIDISPVILCQFAAILPEEPVTVGDTWTSQFVNFMEVVGQPTALEATNKLVEVDGGVATIRQDIRAGSGEVLVNERIQVKASGSSEVVLSLGEFLPRDMSTTMEIELSVDMGGRIGVVVTDIAAVMNRAADVAPVDELLDELFEEHLLVADVLNALEELPGVPNDLRARARDRTRFRISPNENELLARARTILSQEFGAPLFDVGPTGSELEDALRAARAAVKLSPDSEWSIELLAWALFANGRPDEARAQSELAGIYGTYRRFPTENRGHVGTIGPARGLPKKLRWSNRAGKSWNLFPELEQGRLRTDEEGNPYFEEGARTFELKLRDGVLLGFSFHNSVYLRDGAIETLARLEEGVDREDVPAESAELRMALAWALLEHGHYDQALVQALRVLDRTAAGYGGRYGDQLERLSVSWDRAYRPCYPLEGPLNDGLVELEPMRPSGASEALSPRFSTPKTTVVFSNARGTPVLVEWIDFEGIPRPYGRLAPGTNSLQGTAVGHVFRLTDDRDGTSLSFRAVEQAGVIKLSAIDTQPAPETGRAADGPGHRARLSAELAVLEQASERVTRLIETNTSRMTREAAATWKRRLLDLTRRREGKRSLIDPTGQSIVSIDGAGDLTRNVEPARDTRILDAHRGHHALGVAFRQDGRQLASVGSDGALRLWDTATGRLVRTWHAGGWPHRVAFRPPDGSMLATASDDGRLRLWETSTGLLVEEIQHEGDHAYTRGLSFSPDGKRIATAVLQDRTVRVWDVTTGKQLWRFDHADAAEAVAFSPDGLLLADCGRDPRIFLRDAVTGETTRILEAPTGHRCLAFSWNAQIIAAGGIDGRIRLWDTRTGHELVELEAHGGEVKAVAFSRDDQRVIGGLRDNSIKVWSLAGEELLLLRGHSDEIFSLAVSPDGKSVASSSSDGTIRLWDIGERAR